MSKNTYKIMNWILFLIILSSIGYVIIVSIQISFIIPYFLAGMLIGCSLSLKVIIALSLNYERKINKKTKNCKNCSYYGFNANQDYEPYCRYYNKYASKVKSCNIKGD